MGQEHELYIYEYSDLDDDFIFMETKYTLEDIHVLQQENQQLKERIEKAIEYVESNSYFKDNAVKTMIFKDYSNELLEILKGDKE